MPIASFIRWSRWPAWLRGLLLALLCSLGIGLVAWVSYGVQMGQSRKTVQDQLSMVADLKRDQILAWLEQHRNNALGATQGTAMALDVERWIQTGVMSEADRMRWVRRLQALAQIHHYSEVTILKLDGGVLLSSAGVGSALRLSERPMLEAAIQKRAPVFSSIHRDDSLPGRPLWMDVAAPMVAMDGVGSRVVACMIFRLDPTDSLFPMFESWPISSLTAEALLGERRDGSVILLNEPRHRKGSAFELRLEDPRILMVQAVNGMRDLMEGVDYRGVPVLGMGREIPGMPWILVAKMDQAEADRAVWGRTLGMGLVILAFFSVVALSGWSWVRQRAVGLKLAGEARYQALFENTGDALFLVGRDTRFLDVNQVACERLGYTREELLKMGPLDINPPGSEALMAEARAQLDREGHLVLETRHVRKDGTFIPVEVYARCLRLDGQDVFLSSARDITERKLVEAEIRANQARLSAVFENSGVGIAITDATGRFLVFNHAWVDFLGYAPEELDGLRNLDVTHPEDVPATRRQSEALVRGDIDRYTLEKRYLHKDRTVRWGLLSVSAIRDAKGGVQQLIGMVVDITSRKQMEAELASAMDRLSLATKGLGIGIWDWDIQSDQLAWDDEMFRLYGRRREDFSGAYAAWVEALEPADMERGQSAIQAALRGEGEFAMEFRVCWPDGSVHHIKAESKTLRDEAGRPLRMVGINFDITALKQAEEKQRMEEERLRALMSLHEGSTRPEKELIEMGVEEMVKLTGSRIAYLHVVNGDQETLELVAWSASALKECRATVDDHYPLSVAGVWADCIRLRRAVIHNDYQGLSDRHGYPEGHPHVRNHMSVPIFDGDRVVAIAGVGNKEGDYREEDAKQLLLFSGGLWNLIRRKRAEQRLVESEHFLKTIADSMPGMVGYWTREMRCTFANPRYLEWFGRTWEDLQSMDMPALLGVELFARNEPYVRAVLAGQPQHFERHLSWPSGQTSYSWVHYIPDVSDGQVRGFFVLASDITDLKLAQIQLEELNAHLEERTRQAETANHAKSEFLANMSHEIRTPMNAIMGLCHLVLRTELLPKQKDYLVRIQESSRLLLGILNDILDISKIEAGKLEIEWADFNLRRVLDQVCNTASIKAREKGLQFHFEMADLIPMELVGDSLRLGQVLLNLAGNAVKFTEHGQVRVSVHLVELQDAEVRLRFEIRDSGVGIAPEVLPRLFQSFHQADTSTTRRYGGTGLGLAICKRLGDLMGGEISVQSTPGEGSTFIFEVPFGLQKGSPAALLELGGRRVLVVDNDPDARELLVSMLASLGLVATSANSGTEALEKLRDLSPQIGREPDVVLMDWRMPEMDGLELAKAIQVDPRIRQKPALLLVTAYGREEVHRLSEEARLDGVLLKPISISVLRDMLLEILNRRHERLGQAATELANRRGKRSLSGRILLAEDNETNRLVAVEMLESSGFQVETAENGREAVDKALNGSFDLVLMDVQMPELDGLEATALIRRSQKGLPILAMTAHALESERLRCLEAGMNDHISKPFDPDELMALIAKWIPRARRKSDRALGEHGLDGRAQRLLAALRRDLTTQMEALSRGLEQGDGSSVGRAAHSLKGISGDVPGMREEARELDEAVRTGAPWETKAQALMARLEAVLASLPVVEEPAPIRVGPSGIPSLGSGLDLERLDDLLRELQRKLARNSLSARKQMDALREGLGSHPDLPALVDSVERMDFTGAQEALSRLAKSLGRSEFSSR